MTRNILVFVTVFCIAVSGNRIKRHLVFNKGSRLFLSINVRDNLFDVSDLFANVFGFKVDWDLPSSIAHKSPHKARIQRRDLYQGIENFLYHHNFNGTSCIRQFLCEASNILPTSNLFLAQLYEVIFATNDSDILSAYNIDLESNCKYILNMTSENFCPFSLSPVPYGSESTFM